MTVCVSWHYRMVIVNLRIIRVCLSFLFPRSAWEWIYKRDERIWNGYRCRCFDMGFFTLETWEFEEIGLEKHCKKCGTSKQLVRDFK